MLVSKQRLKLTLSAEAIWDSLLSTGVRELPLTSGIALLSVGLTGLHGDPADRFIAATAIVHDATLITADRSLLSWGHQLRRQNASK